MDISTVTSLISSVGFPIVACICLGWFVYTAFNKIMTSQDEREAQLYTVITNAQETNKTLLQTNADFVEVLNTYKTDLDVIKADVTEIKENLKG